MECGENVKSEFCDLDHKIGGSAVRFGGVFVLFIQHRISLDERPTFSLLVQSKSRQKESTPCFSFYPLFH